MFQPCFQIYFPIFSYTDELLSLLSIPIIVLCICKNTKITIKKSDVKLIIALFSILFIGALSNLIYKIQDLKYVIGDILVFYKFFLLYLFSRIIFKNACFKKFILKILIIFFFFGTLYDLVFSINVSSYLRFGLFSNYFIFGTPLGLVAISSLILCCYLYAIKKIDVYVLMDCFVILSSLRFKAFVFILFFIVLAFLVLRNNYKLKINKLVLVGIIAFIITYNEINFYFFSSVDTTARGQLLVNSLNILKDFFPLGSGFGTFASYMSGINYSSLYYVYGLNDIYGLSPVFTSYLSDSFWPMIFAQFGIVGTCLFIYCIWNLYMKIQTGYNIQHKYEYLSKILALSYLLISSISESAFANPICIGFAIILGLEERYE